LPFLRRGAKIIPGVFPRSIAVHGVSAKKEQFVSNDPFNPTTGEFAENIRDTARLDDTELRASMRKIGWRQELPAIVDENGVVIVGHRRVKIAKELGIAPVIEKLEFGSGPAADAARLELATASNVGFEKMDKASRKRIAAHFSEAGWTQKQIADVLDVDQSTISRDTADFMQPHKVSRTDRLGRKNTGRPTGSKKPKKPKQPKPVPLKTEDPERGRVAGVDVKVAPDVWKRFNEKARQEDKSATVKIAELVKNTVDPEIDVASLSMTAQEKLEVAMRQHQRKLDLAFEQHVQNEIRKRVDEMILPEWKKRIEQARKLFTHRRGAMDKATFNAIRRALHPDSRKSISDKVLGEAFDTFMSLEKFLLDEKDSPTEIGPIPDSLAEWDKMRAAATAERKAKRASNGNPLRRR
jgi:ParB-like chromosome segregation protein Spo0J